MEDRNQNSSEKKKKKTENGKNVSVQLVSEKRKKKNSQKTQGDGPARFSQLDDVIGHVESEDSELSKTRRESAHNVLDDDRKENRKKKTKKNNGVGGDRSLNDDRNKSVYVSDEDDMLFNFNIHPVAASIRVHDKSTVINWSSDEKTDTVLIEDWKSNLISPLVVSDGNVIRKMKKKKKRERDEEERHAPYLAQTDVNGSTQQKEKLLDEASSKKHLLTELKKIEKPEVLNIPHNNKCPSGISIRPTFSMAVAGSIVDNAQSLQLATRLAGQIARAAAIFRVDEIVVFDDYDGESYMQDDESDEVGGLFMVRILKYLEVPQYLRRALVPMHRILSSAGKLPPLDAPHHLRKHEWRPFREGVVLDRRPSSGLGSCVDVGLDKDVLVKQSLKPGTRVTVAMGQSKADGDVLQVVDREAARQAGFYWGYTVRYASCLSAVFDECPFEGKYDYCIGTSEHGEKLKSADLVIPKCKHLLVAFGGLSGLEESMELDKKLKKRCIRSVFDRYLNTCPDQGSRTIRTEEAVLISLQYLQAAAQEALQTP